MKTIFGYYCTKHFLKRISERNIPEYLISLCLFKGKRLKKSETCNAYTIELDEIKAAAQQQRICSINLRGLLKITIVTEGQRLITAFSRYCDEGL